MNDIKRLRGLDVPHVNGSTGIVELCYKRFIARVKSSLAERRAASVEKWDSIPIATVTTMKMTDEDTNYIIILNKVVGF